MSGRVRNNSFITDNERKNAIEIIDKVIQTVPDLLFEIDSDAKSESQVLHRTKFSACVALAKFLLESVIRPVWNRKAVKMTGFNLFTKTNLQVFDVQIIKTLFSKQQQILSNFMGLGNLFYIDLNNFVQINQPGTDGPDRYRFR